MSDYLAMDGYAAYIWISYGVSLVVLTGLVVFSLRSYQIAKTNAVALERSDSNAAGQASAAVAASNTISE